MYKKFQLYKLVAPHNTIDQQTDLCHICMDLLISPIKCLSCGSKFCKCCAERWNKGSHRCPNKCTLKWEFAETPSLQVTLECPFHCKTLVIPDHFQEHIKKCQRAPEKYKEEFFEEDMKMEYKCKNNHHLEYVSSPKDIVATHCAVCHEGALKCRSICKTCVTHHPEEFAYCTFCRFPKGLTKTRCPVNHTDFKVKAASSCEDSCCDVCAQKVILGGAACVCEEECDLTVCMKCFLDLQDGDGIPTPRRSVSSRSSLQGPVLSRNTSSHMSETESEEDLGEGR